MPLSNEMALLPRVALRLEKNPRGKRRTKAAAEAEKAPKPESLRPGSDVGFGESPPPLGVFGGLAKINTEKKPCQRLKAIYYVQFPFDTHSIRAPNLYRKLAPFNR